MHFHPSTGERREFLKAAARDADMLPARDALQKKKN